MESPQTQVDWRRLLQPRIYTCKFLKFFDYYFLLGLSCNNLYLICTCFRFVGHGAGARFLDSQAVLKHQMRAAALLFGCSSAALAVRGDQEGQGIILNYLIAGW